MKEKKKLNAKEKKELKEKLKRFSLGTLHVICYILSILFIIVCVIGGVQSCKGTPKKVGAISDNNTGQILSVNDYTPDNQYHLYFDFDNTSNNATGETILNYLYYNNDIDRLSDILSGQDDGFNAFELTLESGNLTLPEYYTKDYWNTGTFASNYWPGTVNIGANDNYNFKDFDICITFSYRYGTRTSGLYVTIPLLYCESNDSVWKFFTASEIQSRFVSTFNTEHYNSVVTLFKAVFGGSVFTAPYSSASINKLANYSWVWLKYFTLEMYHHLVVDFYDFYNLSIWRNFIDGYEISDNIFASNTMPSNFNIYGAFSYNGHDYNNIRFTFKRFNVGDVIQYPKLPSDDSIFATQKYTITDLGFTYYFTFGNIYFSWVGNYGYEEAENIYTVESVLFYKNFLTVDSTHYKLNYSDDKVHVHNDLGFVNASFTSFVIYNDNGFTFNYSNQLEGVSFVEFLNIYLGVYNYYYYFIGDDGSILISLPSHNTDANTEQNFFGKIFSLVALSYGGIIPLLSIQLLPGVTLGMLVFLPFFLIIVLFVVRLFKR